MVDFSVKCLSSAKHSWWFTRHPKFSTKNRREFPRLLIPRLKREREEKRPFVFLARLLNGMSDQEWEEHGLDDDLCAISAPKLQLADVCPSVGNKVSDDNDDQTARDGAAALYPDSEWPLPATDNTTAVLCCDTAYPASRVVTRLRSRTI